MENTTVFQWKSAGLSTEQVSKSLGKVQSYIEHLRLTAKNTKFEDAEASLALPNDLTTITEVDRVRATFESDPLKVIVVIGIGGSNLGTRAVYQALGQQERGPQMLFLETLDTDEMQEVCQTIRLEVSAPNELVIILISKSGTTTESIANYEALRESLDRDISELNDRTVAITDEGSALWKVAGEKGMRRLHVPAKVGGRFSVLSAVGLFPLALAGFDCEGLLRGARQALEENLSAGPEDLQGPARILAALQFQHARDGRRVHNSFVFRPALKEIGLWHRQLMAESLGKAVNDHDTVVHEGVLPIISVGTTDLHSVGQLFFGGPRTILTTFLFAPARERESHRVPNTTELGLVSGIEGKSLEDLQRATYDGVRRAYELEGLPFVNIEFDVLDERALGWYFQTHMIEIMILAHLMEINAFDQPGVESYKKETRNLLGGRS